MDNITLLQAAKFLNNIDFMRTFEGAGQTMVWWRLKLGHAKDNHSVRNWKFGKTKPTLDLLAVFLQVCIDYDVTVFEK